MIEYIIRIVGGALTFCLLVIALRRKFERNIPDSSVFNEKFLSTGLIA